MVPMRFRALGGLLAAGAMLVMAATDLHSQGRDARVPEPGTVDLRASGSFGVFEERFGHPFRPGDSSREPLANEDFPGAVTDEVFAPFNTLRTGLNALFDSIAGPAVDLLPGSVGVSASRLLARADDRVVTFALDVGVLPRVAFGVRVPLVQNWLEVAGFETAVGNVGLNPDPTTNGALLATLGAPFAALGTGAFLPTADSPLGILLQQRVAAAAGGAQLVLPTTAPIRMDIAGIAGTGEFIGGRHSPETPGWVLGDVEAVVSFQLLRPEASAADPGGVRGFRAAVDVGARVPTGTPATADYLVFPKPELGLSGISAGLRTEYSTGRTGVFGSARFERLSSVTMDHTFFSADAGSESPVVEPQVSRLEWQPGNRLSFEVVPFYRLVDEIRLSAGYAFARRAERYRFGGTAGAAVPDAVLDPVIDGAATAHQLRVGVDFSTLAAYRAGRASVPFEARIMVRRGVGGSGGAPAERGVEAQARLFLRLWGAR